MICTKATCIVHLPSKPVYACDDHARQIIVLGRFMGANVVATTYDGDESCANCLQEQKQKRRLPMSMKLIRGVHKPATAAEEAFARAKRAMLQHEPEPSYLCLAEAMDDNHDGAWNKSWRIEVVNGERFASASWFVHTIINDAPKDSGHVISLAKYWKIGFIRDTTKNGYKLYNVNEFMRKWYNRKKYKKVLT